MNVGYLCTYTPKELIDAAGFTPIRIFAGDMQISLATAHIQSYACSQARGSLERALRGELDVQAVVFTRCCDTLMRLADIWERNTDMRVYNIEFPTRVEERSKDYYFNELKDFVKVLEEWGGGVTLESLRESLKLYHELEEKLKRLFSLKPDYEAAKRVQEMNVREAIKFVDERLRKAESEGGKPRVLITGSVCPFVEVYTLFEEAGFALKDDICTGTRFFTFNTPPREIGSVDEGLRFLVDKYFEKAPCPTKHFPNDDRFKYILEMAKDCDGVVFLLLKFCEPHFYDYPQLKERLEEMGKKVLLLELEFPIASIEQLRTRIEAFYEVIA
ncbi:MULTISPECIES: 2-hydroxyacyl-CoA dehydratase subunit D [Archaeoglobus]|jgi:benzoyl-CoA reductase/2-hydroxyglutaryl-CoA dehydratase subunit BcrC/BadD/HgdB|uniref:2-hydroxyglutaryl-CoA dehydratase, subunit beta (HgdB) n=3 Tax=Archaeoglobus fulgidus TaxID=2234 RepID=O28322_ARCFU|nr:MULTISPECIES: 2-hydroxyacyl-CoA dehydratase subunit D [Archaeoglobus]AAB89298.1 2-hydroxyglutaryl-CoA dehydratase, subunit beta (hgdB) [Archaeoglobus fulgidus DSM 4304]AIG98948.1 Benzoyl-CoA reductase/2-hydroxyglutaryl-CoA dehydratase, beta subunit [Archaeoglobus fulgidus DSM 8774]KUJ93788.1 MAG: 2-hydroxyglutaryl-CoA dehydratase, subunit beta (HgdB) [Archaeoglobus fulgidus]KUK06628.1 MAG: 2-hydroxyglutaryl-CoA dehydratase, subunit beta (HgdB) [Archaeoglobus fulgidus]MDI3498335.1 hypothetic